MAIASKCCVVDNLTITSRRSVRRVAEARIGGSRVPVGPRQQRLPRTRLRYRCSDLAGVDTGVILALLPELIPGARPFAGRQGRIESRAGSHI